MLTALLATGGALTSAGAQSATIEFTGSGTIQNNQTSYNINSGDPYDFSILINTDVPDTTGHQSIGGYIDAADMTFTINGQTIESKGTIGVIDSIPNDVLSLQFSDLQNDDGNYDFSAAYFDFTDSDGSAFTGDDLSIDPFLAISNYDNLNLRLALLGQGEVQFNLTDYDVRTIPEVPNPAVGSVLAALTTTGLLTTAIIGGRERGYMGKDEIEANTSLNSLET